MSWRSGSLGGAAQPTAPTTPRPLPRCTRGRAGKGGQRGARLQQGAGRLHHPPMMAAAPTRDLGLQVSAHVWQVDRRAHNVHPASASPPSGHTRERLGQKGGRAALRRRLVHQKRQGSWVQHRAQAERMRVGMPPASKRTCGAPPHRLRPRWHEPHGRWPQPWPPLPPALPRAAPAAPPAAVACPIRCCCRRCCCRRCWRAR